MPFELSDEIKSRLEFAGLCKQHGYQHAVEVGVDQGWFAKRFLDEFRGDQLYLIDPYEPYPEMPWDRTPDLMVAIQQLQPHIGKFRFLKCPSAFAAKMMRQSMPWLNAGFVYIDADHDYANAAADIELWWDVVADGGILAGHDYDPTHPGVVRAVDEFSVRYAVKVMLTHEAECPSWYCYKR